MGFKRQPALPPLGLRNSLTSIAEAGMQLGAPARTILGLNRVVHLGRYCGSDNA